VVRARVTKFTGPVCVQCLACAPQRLLAAPNMPATICRVGPPPTPLRNPLYVYSHPLHIYTPYPCLAGAVHETGHALYEQVGGCPLYGVPWPPQRPRLNLLCPI
jgi:hypothetical protein